MEKKKVLLIDDDIAILKQISFALYNQYDITEAQNREEAFELINNNKYDIAVVDLGLPPYENSFREGRLIVSKFLEETKTKVIVLTGQNDETYPKQLIEMGVFDYIKKPVDIPTLIQALNRASFFIENETQDENIVRLNFQASLKDGLKESAEEAQKQLLLKALAKTDFNINQTAKMLGISRENCYYFLKKFGIKRI